MLKNTVVTFFVEEESGNYYIYLTEKQLNKYPNSYLTLMVPFADESHVVKLDGFSYEVLNEIGDFYINGYWNFNPYLTGKKHKYTFVKDGEKIDSFEKFCDFLGLPSDICDISSDSEEEDYDDEVDDDFNIYSPPSEEDDDYDDSDDYYGQYM